MEQEWSDPEWSRSGVTQSGVELLWSGKELTTKVEEQPWP